MKPGRLLLASILHQAQESYVNNVNNNGSPADCGRTGAFG